MFIRFPYFSLMESVEYISYLPKYQKSFRDLNIAWITQYFEMEKPDFLALDHPQEYILNKGGNIFLALWENEVVGVCAMIKMKDPDYQYELAKMAVSPGFQGKSIGLGLGKTCLDWAKTQGAKKVYLESNRKLISAVHLYRKLGFTEVFHRKSPYKRADILMEYKLKE